jgi:hypothetical protein
MTQFYSDPTREAAVGAWPDMESFYEGEAFGTMEAPWRFTNPPGWYWWACFPGCLPDGEAFGPYETEAEAQESAQERISNVKNALLGFYI